MLSLCCRQAPLKYLMVRQAAPRLQRGRDNRIHDFLGGLSQPALPGNPVNLSYGQCCDYNYCTQ